MKTNTLTLLLGVLMLVASASAKPVNSMLGADGAEWMLDVEGIVPIEYLESTGLEYIDTGIVADSHILPLQVKFQPLVADTTYFFGGGDSSTSGFGFKVIRLANAVISVGFGWTSELNYWNRTLVEAPQTIEIYKGPYGRVLRFNGSGANGLTVHESYSTSFILFGRSMGEAVEPSKPIRIYGAEIGESVFVPVRVGNIGYMLELSSGELFENMGGGRFILGPDILGEDEL